MTTYQDLRFNADPWVWRKARRGNVLHAIRDDDWLGRAWITNTACGRDALFPLGSTYAVAARCRQCIRVLTKNGELR